MSDSEPSSAQAVANACYGPDASPEQALPQGVVSIGGQRFGMLEVVSYAGKRRRDALWLCRCDCGTSKVILGRSLRSGVTKTCGHGMRRPKHGMKDTPTYRSWQAMLTRCTNHRDANYASYGARGITVCDRWRDFVLFFADMGERQPGTSLDRFPNQAGNYEPGNCRWATQLEQIRNSRTVRITCDQARVILARAAAGEKYADIASDFGLKRPTIASIVNGRTWRDVWESDPNGKARIAALLSLAGPGTTEGR